MPWCTTAPSRPRSSPAVGPKSQHTALANGSTHLQVLWLHGGKGDSGFEDDLWKYDIKAPLCVCIECVSSFAHVADSTLREVGAWAEQNQTMKPYWRGYHTMVYDSTQQAWEQSDSCCGCKSRCKFRVWTHLVFQVLWLMGGVGSTSANDLWKYHIEAQSESHQFFFFREEGWC